MLIKILECTLSFYFKWVWSLCFIATKTLVWMWTWTWLWCLNGTWLPTFMTQYTPFVQKPLYYNRPGSWTPASKTGNYFWNIAIESPLWPLCAICLKVFSLNGPASQVPTLFALHGVNMSICDSHMMASSNGNIFRVTGPLWGEFTGPGEFPTQRPVKRSFDVFFDLRLNERLSKQPWGWWFETPSWSLWRHCNDTCMMSAVCIQ